jgi:hypothetical protein
MLKLLVITVFKADCNPSRWVDEQVVLGQESGEEDAMPMLVGALLDQFVEAFQLVQLRTQFTMQRALFG